MRLRHGRVGIELHERRSGSGVPLLLLHPLGESAATWPAEPVDWGAGPVFALDFAGHGASEPLQGGAYHPEHFLADADVALERLAPPCVVVGAGIGAYVALLLAGARPDAVRATCLLGGAGLAGGGSSPPHERATATTADGLERFERLVATASRAYDAGTDPMVALCEEDCRPLDYVESFARAAGPLLFDARVERAGDAPDWWRAAFAANAEARTVDDLASALRRLASVASSDAAAARAPA
jgi:pimeloyl-ACP methyl ester carboxylesterase